MPYRLSPENRETCEQLAGHDRRKEAWELSNDISIISKAVGEEGRFADLFSSDYLSVSGSTSRNTHLPFSPDFDIGLWAKCCVPRPNSDETPCAFRFQSFFTFEEYVLAFAKALAANLQQQPLLCQRLGDSNGIDRSAIEAALKEDPIIKVKGNAKGEIKQITAKFKAGTKNIIEIALGHHGWHYVGLLYNSYWKSQLAQVADSNPGMQDLMIGQVCMLKLLMKNRGLYGKDAGGGDAVTFTSRRLEQLVINGPRDPSSDFLPAALGAIVDEKKKKQGIAALLLATPQDIFHRSGFSKDQEARLKRTRRQNETLGEKRAREDRWSDFLKLSEQVVRGSIDFASEVQVYSQTS